MMESGSVSSSVSSLSAPVGIPSNLPDLCVSLVLWVTEHFHLNSRDIILLPVPLPVQILRRDTWIVDFLLKVFFFYDHFNGHEAHDLSRFQSCVLYLLGRHKKVSLFCHCPLPLNWWSTFGVQMHELVCVLLGFLTNGAPVHANIDGSFSDMDPEISAFPISYILIS